jgi:hypothetical protein
MSVGRPMVGRNRLTLTAIAAWPTSPGAAPRRGASPPPVIENLQPVKERDRDVNNQTVLETGGCRQAAARDRAVDERAFVVRQIRPAHAATLRRDRHT